MSEYPEHDKQAAAIERGSQTVGEFLDWAEGEKGLRLYSVYAGSHGERDAYMPVRSYTDLLAEFFGVDLDKIEAERRMMLIEQANRSMS